MAETQNKISQIPLAKVPTEDYGLLLDDSILDYTIMPWLSIS
jgi:hypothetical protein